MALMTFRPVGPSAFMSRRDFGEQPDFDGAFGISHRGRLGHNSPAIPDQVSSESNAAHYRICLECALPLKTSEQRQAVECRCLLDEDTKDDWLDIGGWEIALILGLAIACMAVSFWFCF